jgi:hypothetical protein
MIHKAAAAARVFHAAAKQLVEVRADADRNETLGVTAGALTAVSDFSANAFERWRHHNEQPTGAGLDEMQLAFNALVAPL